MHFSRAHWQAIAAVLAISSSHLVQAQGQPLRQTSPFQQCAACHSLEPGRNMTGPSLGELFGRKAGSLPGFLRYSEALKRSNVVWNEQTLDAWLKDPAGFIPGNEMKVPAIKSDKARSDLIAYLKAADSLPAAQRAGRRLADLKKADPDSIVKTIRHCRDTYFVTTADGQIDKIWEFNLRFKTDTSDSGPAPGAPVLLGVGHGGDRAAVVFSSPAEMGKFISQRCE